MEQLLAMVKEKIKTNKYIIIDNFTGMTCIDYKEQDECNAANCGDGGYCTCYWQSTVCLPKECYPGTIPCPPNYFCYAHSGTCIPDNATIPDNGERKKIKTNKYIIIELQIPVLS